MYLQTIQFITKLDECMKFIIENIKQALHYFPENVKVSVKILSDSTQTFLMHDDHLLFLWRRRRVQGRLVQNEQIEL